VFFTILFPDLSSTDYERFFNQYILENERVGWALEDFTKPGLKPDDAESRLWQPKVNAVHQRSTANADHLLFHLAFATEVRNHYGAPGNIYLTYSLPKSEKSLYIDLQWFNKNASRLPEAYWMSFQLQAPEDSSWFIEKWGRKFLPWQWWRMATGICTPAVITWFAAAQQPASSYPRWIPRWSRLVSDHCSTSTTRNPI